MVRVSSSRSPAIVSTRNAIQNGTRAGRLAPASHAMFPTAHDAAPSVSVTVKSATLREARRADAIVRSRLAASSRLCASRGASRAISVTPPRPAASGAA
jgi:hypothetical protein